MQNKKTEIKAWHKVNNKKGDFIMKGEKKKYGSPVLTVDSGCRNVFLESDPFKDDLSWDDELIGG